MAVIAEPVEAEVRCPPVLVRACLLALLAETPGHGYELIDRLGSLGLPSSAAGSVYRHLRALEAAGLVAATLETRETGPSRSVHRLTPAGWEALDRDAAALRALLASLDRLLPPAVVAPAVVAQAVDAGRAGPARRAWAAHLSSGQGLPAWGPR